MVIRISAVPRDQYASEVTVRLKNAPLRPSGELLLESRWAVLEEGKTRPWKNGYSIRLDRRPENQGGDQLHIYGPKETSWAYRHDGSRSEPRKYTLHTTNVIRKIVSDVFGIPEESIEEGRVISASEEAVLLEVRIADGL
jgi:hypothetical protein